MGVVIALSYFFYRSVYAIFPLLIVGVVFYKQLQKRSINKQVDIFELQFKECILSVAALLKAGYAVENAFRESERDIKMLFGENSAMVNTF